MTKKYFHKTSWFENDAQDDPNDIYDILNAIRTGDTSIFTKPKPKKKSPKPKVKKETVIPKIQTDDHDIVNLTDAYDIIEETLYDEEQADLAAEIDGDIDQFMNNKVNFRDVLLGVLNDLAKQDMTDFIFIKHESARQLYEQYVNILNKIEAARQTCIERRETRQRVLNKLTAEEREILGIK